jgi:hypothetical protein
MTDRALPPGPVEWDDDGDPVPQPAKESDLADLIQLLEYGRRKGFRVGPMVRIGKITVQVSDLRHRAAAVEETAPEPSIWQEHGYDDRGNGVG